MFFWKFTRQGKFVSSFGGNHIGSPHGTKYDSQRQSLWVTDIERHTVLRMMGTNGVVKNEFGTSGIAGKGVRPQLQFGNVADVAVDDIGNIYITDGDGGGKFFVYNELYIL